MLPPYIEVPDGWDGLEKFEPKKKGELEEEDIPLWSVYILTSKCGISIDKIVRLPEENGVSYVPMRLMDGLMDMMLKEQEMIDANMEESKDKSKHNLLTSSQANKIQTMR